MLRTLLKQLFNIFLSFFTYISVKYKKVFFADGIILINTPTHGNIGDQAIAEAELQFLNRNFPRVKIWIINEDEWRFHKKLIKKSIKSSYTILIHGGGYIGTLWEDEANRAFEIIECFPDNNKILLPQTAFYGNNERLKSDRNRLGNVQNLVIFARDEKSYKIFTKDLGYNSDSVYLVPDIVTTLRIDTIHDIERKNDILFIMRKDCEKMLDNSIKKLIINKINKNGKCYKVSDMFDENFIYLLKRKFIIRKLNEFRASKLVITDRLHGMYFSAITGTPCIALNNVSGKVGEGYKWLRKYDSIRFVEMDNLLLQFQYFLDGKMQPFIYRFSDDQFLDLIKLISNYEEKLL